MKSGIRNNLRNVNLPLGLCLRWSSMNWQGQRAETQWRGGTDRPVTPLSRSCESITRSSLRRTKWRAHRDAYLSNSNSARSCQHIPSSFSRTLRLTRNSNVWCFFHTPLFLSIFCQEIPKFVYSKFNVIYFYHIITDRTVIYKNILLVQFVNNCLMICLWLSLCLIISFCHKNMFLFRYYIKCMFITNNKLFVHHFTGTFVFHNIIHMYNNIFHQDQDR